MSYISTQAKMFVNTKRFGRKKIYRRSKNKAIADCEGTSFGGTLSPLTKKQYEKGMALSRKMKNMSSW